jgi:hypothetical protein
MVAEEVLLTLTETMTDNLEFAGLPAAPLAHVDATFWMRNQGPAEESFDVWFPLGIGSGYGKDNRVADFRAWVDGAPVVAGEAQTEDPHGRPIPWATWPARFEPGKDVVLRVTYATAGTGWGPYYTLEYLLETGAGWWGPIRQGTITFRLPYAVNPTNVVLGQDWYPKQVETWDPPNPGWFTVDGTDVVWRFQDLEPMRADNLLLTVLAPPIWTAIVDARQTAALAPAALGAQLNLARTLVRALSLRHGVEPVGDHGALVTESEGAYRRALALDPQNAELHIEYVQFLADASFQIWPIRAGLEPALERARALAPNDPRLYEIGQIVADMQQRAAAITQLVTATPPVADASTPTPIATPPAADLTTPAPVTPASATAPSATVTPIPPASPTAPRPDAASTGDDAGLDAPAASPSAAPLASPADRTGSGGRICPGTLAAAVLPMMSLLWLSRIRRD